jgi:hypothetical protein
MLHTFWNIVKRVNSFFYDWGCVQIPQVQVFRHFSGGLKAVTYVVPSLKILTDSTGRFQFFVTAKDLLNCFLHFTAPLIFRLRYGVRNTT